MSSKVLKSLPNCADQMEKDVRHHEEVKGVQETSVKEVKNLCLTIEEMGSPFKDSSEDLLVLDTRTY